MSDNNDDGWRSNGRPQSTMAQSFSNTLDNVFGIDNSLDGLARIVEQKKQALSSQNAELEALEARLRATEERLRERQSRSSPQDAGTSRYAGPQARPPVGHALSSQQSRPHTPVRHSPATALSTAARPVVAGAKAPSYYTPAMPGAFDPPSDSASNRNSSGLPSREGFFHRKR